MDGTYAFGGAIDYIWAGLDASVLTPRRTIHASHNAEGTGDSHIIPAQISWHSGEWHWQTTLLVLDWGVAVHFGQGWEAGVVGNVVEQIGGDHGAGALLGPFKAQSLGIGPSIAYSTEAGHTPISFSAKWEHDFNAHNTFEGDVIALSLTVGL